MANQVDPSSLSTLQRMALMRQAEAAIARDPRNVDALTTLAGLYSAEGNSVTARTFLLKASAIRKKDPDLLRRLVSVCNDLNDLNEARKYARKLVEMEPRNAQNHKTLGLIVEHLGKPKAAIESYMRANQLQPGSAQTLHDIGRCHSLAGDHDAALQWYEKALAADPYYALALYGWATGRKFTRDEVDDFLEKATESTRSPRVRADPSVHANLHYAMGKALDDCRRHDEAFAHFVTANGLRRSEESDDQISLLNSMAAFTREFLASRAGMGHASRRPIFVLGMPRSGTTLTESLCGAHSMITAGDEQTYLPQIAKELGRDSSVVGAFQRNLQRLSQADIVAIGDRYLSLTRSVSGTTEHFTDKLPHNFVNIGLIAMVFPHARIIHCRRHPLDNCFSLYSNSMSRFHNRYKTDLARLGVYYRQYLQLMDHWKRLLPGRIHDVFYEDLVVNTELNARSMISFLGLEWEDGVLDRTGSQRSVRTLSAWQVRQPVYQSSSGKWRAYEHHLAPLIAALGPHVAAYEAELAALGGTGDIGKESAA